MRLLTLSSILVATDLGRSSGAAVRTAAQLARLAGAQLHLLHVPDAQNPRNRLQVEEHFRLSAPGMSDPDAIYVVPGAPADVILEHANRLDADVIVLGPHRRGSESGELGSTATRLVRDASCPSLVVSSELRLPLRRVIVPIDLSDAARGALAVALTWASALRPRGEVVHLDALHVAPGSPTQETEEAVHTEVGRARSRAGGASYVQLRERVVAGAAPAATILEMASSEAPDLLVMASRGEARPTPDLGSVSAAVARATPCPLLLVPPDVWQAYSSDPPRPA